MIEQVYHMLTPFGLELDVQGIAGANGKPHIASLEHRWVFVYADEETAALEDWQLRHLAGLFAARYRLNIPGERWSVTAFGRSDRDRSGRWLPDCIPDAIWTAE